MKGLNAKAAAELVAEWERNTWQYRAIAATRGNRTFLGCCVLAILGIAPDHPPRYVYPTIYIDGDGMVRSFMQKVDGTVEGLAEYHAAGSPEVDALKMAHMPKLCKLEHLRDNCRRLADHLKMTDVERVEFFDLFRKWVEYDARAVKDATI
jgi:hypothetical protein